MKASRVATGFRRVLLVLASVLCGLLIQGGLGALVMVLESQAGWAYNVLLWNVALMLTLPGAKYPIGHHADGSPMYEGTPVTLLYMVVGVVVGVFVYSYVSYLLLRSRLAWRFGETSADTRTMTGTKSSE